jgi:hypothetical protein
MLLVARPFLLILLALVLVPSMVRAADLTLAWDPPDGPAPAGYRVRYGAWPGPVTEDRDAGKQTTLKVTSLAPGTTYEFHVVAYDAKGLTSGPSNYLKVTIPAIPTAPPPAPAPTRPPTDTTVPRDTTQTLYFPGTGAASGSEPYRTFLAEGATSATFSTRLSLANPTTRTATATVYLRPDGETHSYTKAVSLPPFGHVDIDARTVLGSQSAAFGIGVTSSTPIGVSRTMTWDGGIGGHTELATSTPARRWYFAEGSTRHPFELFYLLFNPGPSTATVAVTYLLPTGATAPRYHEIAAGDRLTIWVDQDGREMGNTDAAATIESVNGQPIVAERAMYLTGRSGFIGGHASLGAVAPRTHWLMAEGATGKYFTTYVLLANPHAKSAPVTLKFRRPDGVLVQRAVTVAARSRLTVDVAGVDPRLRDTAVWTEVIATDALPVVAERVMWWPGTTWQDGHAASAAPQPAAKWLAVGGRHGDAQRHATYVLVANAGRAAQSVRLTVLGPQGPLANAVVSVPGASRYNLDMGAAFPQIRGGYSVLVEAIGGEGRLVVEQAMYWDAGGQKWAAGTAGAAKPLN